MYPSVGIGSSFAGHIASGPLSNDGLTGDFDGFASGLESGVGLGVGMPVFGGCGSVGAGGVNR